jgi:Zn-dependent protease
LAALKEDLHQQLSQLQSEKACEAVTMSEETKRMLELSMDSRDLVSRPYLGTEHLLLGMMRDLSGRGYSILKRRGLTYNKILNNLAAQPTEPLAPDRVLSKLSLNVPYIPTEKLTLTGIFQRISPVFWGLLMATVLSGMAAYYHWFRADVAVFLLVTLGWVVSVSLHEFGHALVAYQSGDLAVIQRGYLTLNPLRYTHGFMSIVLPVLVLLLGGIGLPGGAVYINLGAVKSKKLRSLVAIAGPLMTGLIIVVLAVLLAFFHRTANFSQHSEFIGGLNFLVFIQIWALVFNLLPIPGFDGFGAIMPFLPREIASRLYRASSLILFVFISLYLWDTPVQRLFWQLVYGVTSFLNVDRELIFYALDLYRFW